MDNTQPVARCLIEKRLAIVVYYLNQTMKFLPIGESYIYGGISCANSSEKTAGLDSC